MAEEKNNKLKFDDIKEAVSSLQALSEKLKDCKEKMNDLKEGNVSALEGIWNLAVAADDAYQAFGDLSGKLSGLKTYLKEGLDTSITKKFSSAVTSAVEKIGNGLQKCPDAVNKFKDSIKALPEKVQTALGTVIKGASKMAKEIQTSFSTMKEHIKNFDFKEFMEKVKQLPSKVSSSFKSLVSSATTALKELPGKAKASVKQIPSILEGGFKGAGARLSASASSIGAVAGRMMTVGLVGGVALAAVAIVGFIALFQKLMESNEAFREKITAAWAQVKEAFQPAIDAFNTFKESIMGITETDAFDSFVESFGDGIVGLIDIISEVVGIVADLLSGYFRIPDGAVGRARRRDHRKSSGSLGRHCRIPSDSGRRDPGNLLSDLRCIQRTVGQAWIFTDGCSLFSVELDSGYRLCRVGCHQGGDRHGSGYRESYLEQLR